MGSGSSDRDLKLGRFSALLADDVPELRRLLRHVLEWSDRFTVVGEAENGAQAIDLAGAHRPDLLLLDISMPVMDGMEALPRIRSVSPDTKVVILSGFEAERLAERAEALGASAYIEKGTPPAILVQQLLGVLRSGVAVPPVSPSIADEPPAAPVFDVSPEEMMSLVAHEIRNPLAVIQGFGGELQARWDALPDPQRRDAVRRMTERARYLTALVNNLMFLRRLEGGALSQNVSAQDVSEFVISIQDELSELSRSHRLLIDLGEDIPHACFDVLHLRQVLTNLIVNAAKFSPASEPIVLRVARADDGGVGIYVSDNGPGVPSALREAVFGKFQRGTNSGSGIGLGLFVARSLMNAMGGSLDLTDQSPGTTFLLSLRAEPHAHAPFDREPRETIGSRANPASGPLPPESA